MNIETGKRVLFVDDEHAIRETLPVVLRNSGFTVTVAARVSEALDHIRKQQFDILLCDLHIEHDSDGYEVVRAIRAIDPTCVAVILTAYPDMESAIEGIRNGVDDYIIKPMPPGSVGKLLERILSKRRENTARLPLGS